MRKRDKQKDRWTERQMDRQTNYDPQPGLKKREERQRKIDAGEWGE